MTEQLFHRHLLLSKYCFGEDFRPSDWKKVIWTTNIETTYFNFQLHSKTSNHLFTYSSNLEDSAQGHSHGPGLPPPVIRMLYMCYILLLLCITFLNIKITEHRYLRHFTFQPFCAIIPVFDNPELADS